MWHVLSLPHNKFVPGIARIHDIAQSELILTVLQSIKKEK